MTPWSETYRQEDLLRCKLLLGCTCRFGLGIETFQDGLEEFRPTRVLPPAAAECHFAHPAEFMRKEGGDRHV